MNSHGIKTQVLKPTTDMAQRSGGKSAVGSGRTHHRSSFDRPTHHRSQLRQTAGKKILRWIGIEFAESAVGSGRTHHRLAATKWRKVRGGFWRKLPDWCALGLQNVGLAEPHCRLTSRHFGGFCRNPLQTSRHLGGLCPWLVLTFRFA